MWLLFGLINKNESNLLRKREKKTVLRMRDDLTITESSDLASKKRETSTVLHSALPLFQKKVEHLSHAISHKLVSTLPTIKKYLWSVRNKVEKNRGVCDYSKCVIKPKVTNS